MADLNLPVWPFRPNWSTDVLERLEWLTSILRTAKGAEQRRALRLFPRRTFEFQVVGHQANRSLLDGLTFTHGGRDWIVPLWHVGRRLAVSVASGSTVVPVGDANLYEFEEGSYLVFLGTTPFDNEAAIVAGVTSDSVVIESATAKTWPVGTKVYAARKGRFTDQPTVSRLTDNTVQANVRFRLTGKHTAPSPVESPAGPMILDGLIVNSYHHELGRGGYFHHNSGTSEGQFVFIHALYRAYEELHLGTTDEVETANFFRSLAEEMMDAMGDGSRDGPILRQPISDDPDTITLLHWLFAARGDVPGQSIVYNFEAPNESGVLKIPNNWRGGKVYRVWSIYPATSALLYPNPSSPAYDMEGALGERQIALDEGDWVVGADETVITIPAGAPANDSWKIVYGYIDRSFIPVAKAQEAYPSWTLLPAGYSACAPDTFRWFELAATKAIEWDDRPGKAAQWSDLRDAMRMSCVKGQAITDLREVIKPMPGFDAIPAQGNPDGMFCYSDHPDARPPIGPGLDRHWSGYDFWSRDLNGDILGNIPASAVVSQVQLGRGFNDTWREATSYQDADQYLYVALSCSKVPVAAREHFLVFVSDTKAYDADHRWLADIGALPEFDDATDAVYEFFIPRTAFKLRTFDETGESIWGSVLPAGTKFENFGISSEMVGAAYTIRLRALRLVSGPSSAWVDANQEEAIKGSQMPFFPGSLPFAINADTKRQQFVGWNGSPFHGYQLPDFWWWCGDEADAVHPDLTVADLPIPNRVTGALTHPISPTNVNGSTKPKNALLAEQQVSFLRQAQVQYQADGGGFGPFAHTYVINTPARISLGNPTPHTWVYVNDDPNTRWVGYQVRVVESLARFLYLADDDTTFQDAKTLTTVVMVDWLQWLNTYWTPPTGGFYGMPTDFPDPSVSDPQTLYEEPHAAALVLRACIWLKLASPAYTTLCNGLITRCWTYLETQWRGDDTWPEMKGTWSPEPEALVWYGFWHGEILTTLTDMLANAAALPAGIDTALIRARILTTKTWIETKGVRHSDVVTIGGLVDTYREFSLLTKPPNEIESLGYDYDREIDELDPSTGLGYYVDTAETAFTTQQYLRTLRGGEQGRWFSKLLHDLKGGALPIWVPTFFQDFSLVDAIEDGDSTLVVKLAGYTEAGGPREGRQDICVFLRSGEVICRRVTASAIGSGETETLALDAPIRAGVTPSQVLRISFLALAHLDQDAVEISHKTDVDGVSTCRLTFRRAPNIRRSEAAFYTGI